MTKSSEHDFNAVRKILPSLKGRTFIGDKAYSIKDAGQILEKEHGVCLYTPVKLLKGQSVQTRQFKHAADKLFSTAVSRLRQSIESLFNWLIEKLIFKELPKSDLVKD